ncbi:sialate O-acetylesterase [Pseudomaricurvus alkylphenolicus]|jgi:hypothetical protein|uniref:sialate O-acetylesterase n=1 Tax=Pseudomaricurvus alkylphenolicus TaxID=1306991 RepID=UPI0014201547|nr:sialate O-acetylesterase [Pseudomaricurvus alkylphenolicus]NIB38245.1 sialate O-acetylesterase [Pseudomaricurvus alkylphenolicus]
MSSLVRVLFPLAALLFSQIMSADTYQLYFLGGQSNMVGFGFNDKLPDKYRFASNNILIFNGHPATDNNPEGGDGIWQPLQPGFGLNFSFDGKENKLSDRFGPEISFGYEMLRRKPDTKIAIIKYAMGGTSLVDGVSGYGSWDPNSHNTNQYNYFLRTVKTALSDHDIDGDGVKDRLIPSGMVWMQGEADAYDNKAASDAYLENLKTIIGLFRSALQDSNLPVVIGQITDAKAGETKTVMQYSKAVQAAQHQFVEQDRCSDISVVTEEIGYLEGDDWHYNSEGYLRMGTDFAHKITSLQDACL